MSVKEHSIFRNNFVIRYIFIKEFSVAKWSGLKGNKTLPCDI